MANETQITSPRGLWKGTIVTLMVLSTVTVAHAGKPVYGISKDLGEALEKAVEAVEKAAVVHGTCVSTYPSMDTCREVKGYWECHGIRANHGGSCGKKLDLWGEVVKTAKEGAKIYTGADLKAAVLKKEQEVKAKEK